jgi:hypothetical protein
MENTGGATERKALLSIYTSLDKQWPQIDLSISPLALKIMLLHKCPFVQRCLSCHNKQCSMLHKGIAIALRMATGICNKKFIIAWACRGIYKLIINALAPFFVPLPLNSVFTVGINVLRLNNHKISRC